MTRSGLVLEWTSAKLSGPILDKHSTGGVGDSWATAAATPWSCVRRCNFCRANAVRPVCWK